MGCDSLSRPSIFPLWIFAACEPIKCGVSCFLLAGALLLNASVFASDDSDAWFDADEALRERVAAVNEGELRLLAGAPDPASHHHENRLLIRDSALIDGWVELSQCHHNLDRVAQLQILFRPESIRNIRLISYRNMAPPRVDGHAVELQDIGVQSSVCIAAETHALHRLAQGGYELRNGPYMRRFLDGYYPIRVTIDIHYPRSLELVDHEPVSQPGFRVSPGNGWVRADAWFEGKLSTRFRFREKEQGASGE